MYGVIRTAQCSQPHSQIWNNDDFSILCFYNLLLLCAFVIFIKITCLTCHFNAIKQAFTINFMTLKFYHHLIVTYSYSFLGTKRNVANGITLTEP